MFYIKKVLLDISQNSQENTCVRASFLIDLQTGLQHFEKETLAQVVSCEFSEISKDAFFTENLWATVSGLQKFTIGKKGKLLIKLRSLLIHAGSFIT